VCEGKVIKACHQIIKACHLLQANLPGVRGQNNKSFSSPASVLAWRARAKVAEEAPNIKINYLLQAYLPGVQGQR
jgi:hypothetical protein